MFLERICIQCQKSCIDNAGLFCTRAFGFLPCFFVLVIIACGYYVTTVATFIPLLSSSLVGGILGLVVTQLLALNIVINFLLSVVCDPGGVPSSWKPKESMMKTTRGSWSRKVQLVETDSTGDVQPMMTWEFKRNGAPRFCRYCATYKPDRTHHCRSCKRCILKMDHHCPWINNCVGFYNQKFFILFVYYAFLGCLFASVTGVMALKRALFIIGEEEGKQVVVAAVQVICYCLTTIFGVALLFFAVFHTMLVLKGRTTIEMHEIRDPARARMVRKYNLGWKRNWKKVFGNNWLYWFLPVRWSIDGDGLSFESNMDEQQMSLVESANEEGV